MTAVIQLDCTPVVPAPLSTEVARAMAAEANLQSQISALAGGTGGGAGGGSSAALTTEIAGAWWDV